MHHRRSRCRAPLHRSGDREVPRLSRRVQPARRDRPAHSAPPGNERNLPSLRVIALGLELLLLAHVQGHVRRVHIDSRQLRLVHVHRGLREPRRSRLCLRAGHQHAQRVGLCTQACEAQLRLIQLLPRGASIQRLVEGAVGLACPIHCCETETSEQVEKNDLLEMEG